MTVKQFTFNPFQTNCYVCHSNGEAVLVDPSCMQAGEIDEVVNYIKSENLSVKHLLLTHGHLDHIFGCKAIAKAFDMGFKMHVSDEPLIEQAPMQARMYGMQMEAQPMPVAHLQEGDTIQFGEATWDVVHTPGHSPGSVCFIDKANKFVIAGDVVFYDSIGRTDLWQGSLPELMRSIFQKLMVLADDVTLYPGHGPSTTVGREKSFNPFLIEHREG